MSLATPPAIGRTLRPRSLVRLICVSLTTTHLLSPVPFAPPPHDAVLAPLRQVEGTEFSQYGKLIFELFYRVDLSTFS